MAKQKKSTEELPFLEVTPPPLAVRALGYIVLIIFLTASVAAILIEIPETISGSFVLVPVKGNDPVRISDRGFIEKVNVSEGDVVKKDQTLFVVQSESVGTRTADFQTSQTTARSAEDRLKSIRAKYQNQTQADLEEERKLRMKLDQLKEMIELNKKQLQVANDTLASYQKLNEEGISSRVDINNRKLQASTIEMEVKQLETELSETQSALEKQHYLSNQRDAEFRASERSVLEEQQKSEIKMDALDKELTNANGNRLMVPSPCSGVVLRLVKKSPGTFVEAGEALCEMACSDRELQAEVTVPQLGVGRIGPGQGVKLLYDAFPYQRYGVKIGTVVWVSPASIANEGKEVFPVRVRLQEQNIQVKGALRPLLPGMKGAAQIVVDRRTLISYAFAPIRQLKEMMSSPPESTPK